MKTEAQNDGRQQFVSDLHRPQYHFLPPANWMNDPNGVIQWQGQYHIFYQHNPHGSFHAMMNWGHAVSTDLLHWKDLPIALTPTPNSPDEGGVWSGCAVDHDGTPTIIYTGISEDRLTQVQCVATSNDDLLIWEKYASNPIIANTPAEMKNSPNFRDPFVWHENGMWKMVISGSRIEGIGGAIFLYQSLDLYNWEYRHPLLMGDLSRYGIVWECPNFFQLGDKWVLLISVKEERPQHGPRTKYVMCFVGDFVDNQFKPEYEAVLDKGYFYAPLTQLDKQGRRLMWAWLPEGRSEEAQKVAGWTGVLSIPRVLTLGQNGRLEMEPVGELEILRSHHLHIDEHDLEQTLRLDISGLALELDAIFVVGSVAKCVLSLACSASGNERIDIIFDSDAGQLIVERHYNGANVYVESYTQKMEHTLDDNETLQLKILFDCSVLEIIANRRISLTSRVYLSDIEKRHIEISGTSNSHLLSLDIWEIASVW